MFGEGSVDGLTFYTSYKKRSGLLVYARRRCNVLVCLSVQSVLHPSPQAFCLQTEFSSVIVLISACNTEGFTGQRLRYLKSNRLYHLNGDRGEECRNAVLCVCLMSAGTQLLWQPWKAHLSQA